jgi:urease accessory protein
MSATLITLARRGLPLALLTLAGAAQAHTGHGAHSLSEGLAHPLGADHLLAMVAVGLWSAAALPARRAWMGPMAFVLALVASAALGASGWRLGVGGGVLEALVATSVVLFGVLLAGARQWPVQAGLSLMAVSALVHGLAHGAELPAGGSFAAYAVGFVLSTVALHAGGWRLGQFMSRAQPWAWRLMGGLFSAAGLLMLARI